MNQNLINYYHQRAQEYDVVYQNPLEQKDLQKSTQLFQKLFARKTILEIACGTGYWTQLLAQSAIHVMAIDVNASMLEIARNNRNAKNILYRQADMYDFNLTKKYDGLFGGFVWSHIPLQELDVFLLQLKDHLQPKATIAFIDSNPVPDTLHDQKKLVKIDEYSNTYQARSLRNGETYLVLKNFPTTDFLYQKLSLIADNVECIQLDYYWIAIGELKV